MPTISSRSRLAFTDRFPLARERIREMVPHIEQPLAKAIGEEECKRLLELLCEFKITDAKSLATALKSKLWRMNNLYTITGKESLDTPFIFNYGQWMVYVFSIGHKRIVIVKSRQQGISTLWLESFLDDCLFNTNFKAGMVSFGNVQTQDLLDRVRYTWDNFPSHVKNMLQIKKQTSNRTKELSFNNNSKLLITNRFRGSTLQRLHLSELGKIAAESPQKAIELIEGDMQTLHAHSKAIAESTAEGENLLTEVWREGVRSFDEENNVMTNPEAFRPIFLSFLDDPACTTEAEFEDIPESIEYFKDKPEATKGQRAFWIMKYKSLGEGVYKEFPATSEEAFRLRTEGTVFAKLYNQFATKRRDIETPFLPDSEGGIYTLGKPLYVAFDLGVNDPTFMIWFQAYLAAWESELKTEMYNKRRPRFKIIYEKILTDDDASMMNVHEVLNQVLKIIPGSGQYAPKYETLILPHDAKQRSAQEKVRSRYSTLVELGWRNLVVTKKISKESIANLKELLQYTEIDVNHCPLTDKAFRNLKRKRDNVRDVWLDDIQHDDHSHPMDSTMYGVNHTYKNIMTFKEGRQDDGERSYSYY